MAGYIKEWLFAFVKANWIPLLTGFVLGLIIG
jgi:hypothetical protein